MSENDNRSYHWWSNTFPQTLWDLFPKMTRWWKQKTLCHYVWHYAFYYFINTIRLIIKNSLMSFMIEIFSLGESIDKLDIKLILCWIGIWQCFMLKYYHLSNVLTKIWILKFLIIIIIISLLSYLMWKINIKHFIVIFFFSDTFQILFSSVDLKHLS